MRKARTAAARAKPGAAKKRVDKRGTPKGKGTRTGGPGAEGRGGKPKGRIGNPPFIATHEQRIQVEAYIAAGAQQWLIAEYLGISDDTLTRHFRVELEFGKQRAISKIGASMVKKALEGDHDAAKYVLARIGGWKQTTAVEQSGPNGAPIEVRDMSRLTVEQLAALAALDPSLDAD
jgi:hypothetical protein